MIKIAIEERKNLYTYLLLLLFAGLGIYYGRTLEYLHPNVRVWDVLNIFIMFLGIPFVFLQSRAHLPNFWQKSISFKNRFVKPFLIGLVFGVLDVLVFKVMLHPQPYTELPPFLQPFPYSVFLYISGAFEVEVFYRLIPLTLILWLGSYFKKGKYLNYFFWVGAVLTSLREPLEQLGNETLAVMVYALSAGFLMNLSQAVFFRKAGFLSSFTVRLGHYLVWHILLGIYVEYYELLW